MGSPARGAAYIYPQPTTHSPPGQVYELERFQVTHIQKYPGPILSLGLSGDAGLLAVGLADGTLTVRKHAKPRADPAKAGILVGRRSRWGPSL